MLNIKMNKETVENIEVFGEDSSTVCAEIIYAVSLIYGRLRLHDKQEAEMFKTLLCKALVFGEDRFFCATPANIVQHELSDKVKVNIGDES